MSKTLTLFFLHHPDDLKNNYVHPNNALRTGQNSEIIGQLIPIGGNKPTLRTQAIPAGTWVDINDNDTREDEYGDELKFIYAQELKKLKLPEDASYLIRAIKAFVDALPNEAPIIIYWS